MAPEYRITMQTGPTPGKEIKLDKREMFLGRDLSNDIVVNDTEVSRRHTRFFAQGDTYVVEDLGSTNGTYVNGQRLVSPYILRPGEMVAIGEHISFIFDSPPVDLDKTMVGTPAGAPGVFQQPYQAQPPMAPQQAYPPAAYPPAAPPAYPPAQPAYVPQQPPMQPQYPGQYPPPEYAGQYPPPDYAGQVPMMPGTARRGLPKWALIVIVVAAAILLLCIVPLIVIDSTNSWCSIAGGIFNMIQPGACP